VGVEFSVHLAILTFYIFDIRSTMIAVACAYVSRAVYMQAACLANRHDMSIDTNLLDTALLRPLSQNVLLNLARTRLG
jgi:hypothetical protein